MERRSFMAGVGAVAAGAGVAAPSAARAAPGPLRAQIVMYDGVEEQDFAGPYEVFSLASGISGGAVQVSYVTGARPRTVVAAFGTRVAVDKGWSPGAADVIVVPGGGFRRPSEPGIWPEIEKGDLPRALAAARRPGLTIASVCTGAIILAAAGLTSGRPCTTHNGAKAELAARGGVVKNVRVVDDGDLVTAAGITSGLELALHLVRREVSADLATRVEQVLEYEARGTVWTP